MQFLPTGAALSAAVACFLILMLLRGGRNSSGTSSPEVEIYKAQLKEIESDQRRQQLSAEESEESVREISRRLLRAHDRALRARPGREGSRIANAVAAAAILFVLVPGALAIHALIGRPQMPDMPLHERIGIAASSQVGQQQLLALAPSVNTTSPDAELLLLTAKLRRRLSDNPDDLEGRRILVQSELLLGNLRAAIQNQESVILSLSDRTPSEEFSLLADLLISEANGFVSIEAAAALKLALLLNPENPTARYYVAVLHLQNGDVDAAFDTWRQLISGDSTPAPWAGLVLAALPEVFVSHPDYRRNTALALADTLLNHVEIHGGSAEDWSTLIKINASLQRKNYSRDIFNRARSQFRGKMRELEIISDAAAQAGISH
ncbi:MAG: c-type cytochrome biogenesis protein CcmI [Rhodobacteraceae bacterium]|nr:c-type cytochrome biogenesis protein CcmI [Paracoccaceae bacterium]